MEVVYLPKRKWTRSADGWFFGVCEGLGKSFNVSPGIIRLVWLLSIFLLGTGLLVYFILAFNLPKDTEIEKYEKPKYFGVCFKLSRKFNIELGLVRSLTVLSFFLSLGTTALVYIVACFVLPEEKNKVYI